MPISILPITTPLNVIFDTTIREAIRVKAPIITHLAARVDGTVFQVGVPAARVVALRGAKGVVLLEAAAAKARREVDPIAGEAATAKVLVAGTMAVGLHMEVDLILAEAITVRDLVAVAVAGTMAVGLHMEADPLAVEEAQAKDPVTVALVPRVPKVTQVPREAEEADPMEDEARARESIAMTIVVTIIAVTSTTPEVTKITYNEKHIRRSTEATEMALSIGTDS
jgi:hypothetical protein